ncbi:bifunctional (p)ppGpp synthetase/guanosine-3',5'-bis(diphosphate) 3'-pyrophosphohydrolase [Candidatus Parcubacteria bacterium]|nr:bifunctional (p)ppGpp synthetase/guanosine-3',5'-bis(diphosphate) 3'-pyrophosphohydrolase [Candidatus Parcubacteria bacterium]
MDINQIINKVKENEPDCDIGLVELAYHYADEAHRGQKRRTGDPYIVHSLHTAYLLAQIKADLNTVIAGILHDVPEDTDRTLDDIKKEFGEEIATLVEGITKLSKIKYRGIERYRESLRKMFLFMAQDLRVILIKFCDRLHNLRTLDALPEKKRIRIAQETMEIYAPIAGLLGVWRLKWQMEDICLKYLHPKEYKDIEYKYEVEKKTERTQYIQRVKNALDTQLLKAGINYKVEGRFKHLYSIYKKMQKKDRKFDEIYDVFALRIIVPSISDCYKTLGIIHALWRPKQDRIKDYIAVPKPNGYRSLHTTVYCIDNKATEFQIRTMEMHEESLYGIAAHWYYKQKQGIGRQNIQSPRWIDEILNIQKEAKNTNEFINDIKLNIFKGRIFVFTPKGDVFDLPEGSTAVDFAYSVHTEIGDKTTGALVNNQMTPLDRILKNGDSVEIITNKNRKAPNKDWLKFVKTHRAKEKIKQAHKNSRLEQIRKIIPGI